MNFKKKVEQLSKALEGNTLLSNQLKFNKKIVDEWKFRYEILEKRMSALNSNNVCTQKENRTMKESLEDKSKTMMKLRYEHKEELDTFRKDSEVTNKHVIYWKLKNF